MIFRLQATDNKWSHDGFAPTRLSGTALEEATITALVCVEIKATQCCCCGFGCAEMSLPKALDMFSDVKRDNTWLPVARPLTLKPLNHHE